MDRTLDGLLVGDADILDGALCFVGTRVPVELLFDYVLTGASLEDFLVNYPEVTRQQALGVLEWERNQVSKSLRLERAS